MSSRRESSRPGPSRRDLLAASAIGVGIGAFGLAELVAPPQAQAQTGGTLVRRSLATLHSASPEILSLRRGVAEMKRRPFSDPTSWSYQAAIHGLGFAPPPGIPQQMLDDMRQCVHGASFGGPRHFLPWHRMYLHFFERIVRDASGDPDFALPYWNYSAPGGASLPFSFRVPADFTNPLYESRRNGFNPNINAGESLPFNFVDTRTAMSQFDFNTFSDRLEGTPHGAVHVGVGGVGGLMSSVPSSAQDPIFWMHHCNVDRLWTRWLADMAGASNPGDSAWLDGSWSFYDETGTRQTMTVREVLDNQQQLGYRYDDELPAPTGIDPCACAGATESGGIELMLASAGGGVTLSGNSASVSAEVEGGGAESGGAEGFVTTEEDGQRPVILRLEDIDYEEEPGVVYEIYVNLPEGETADAAGPYYAGLLAPFGLNRSDAPVEIDITGVLNRQVENELFLGGEIDVQFRPVGVPADATESGIIIPEMSVGKVSVVRK